MRKGILLVNLGTPDSPSTRDVGRYLGEFLMDPRVIDVNPVLRTLLVKGIIVPFRSRKSGKFYQAIWDKKTGSPLIHYSLIQKHLLQLELGEDYQVELAMRYQNPSIASALKKLKDARVDNIFVVALFPQYASATTGSVYKKVMEIVSDWQTIPSISFAGAFYDNELKIEAFADNGRKYHPDFYDHVLFSFHGLPQRQLIKCDDSQQYCQKTSGCCHSINDKNKHCYAAQCHRTAFLIAQKLKIPEERYTTCFQSRLGNAQWIQPYTSDVISKLAREGKKRILVFCPAFIADCLETVHEIKIEYDKDFKAAGGDHIQLVESLNYSPKFIQALKQIVIEH